MSQEKGRPCQDAPYNIQPLASLDAPALRRKSEVLLSGEDTCRVWRAMMLAPTHEVCCALLRGEQIPVDRLDAEWVARFGLDQEMAMAA